MFAILFSDVMDPFYNIVMSFPTLIFTVFVILSVFYWCLAVLGLIDLDFLHIDFHHGDADFNLEGSDHLSSLNVLGGILFKFGLNDVPLAIIISLISLFVYAAFILVGYIGIASKKMNVKTILISSISFFIITNFGVWLIGYPKTMNGLLECYTLAIPFFRNSLIGDFFYAGVMYYAFQFISNRYLKTA